MVLPGATSLAVEAGSACLPVAASGLTTPPAVLAARSQGSGAELEGAVQLRSFSESLQRKTRGNSLDGKPPGLPDGYFPDFDTALVEVKSEDASGGSETIAGKSGSKIGDILRLG